MQLITRTPSQPTSGTSWADGVMVAFDTETSSASPESAFLVSAAVVIDIPGSDQQVYKWLARPPDGEEIDIGAVSVHGISTEHAREHGEDAVTVIREILARFDAIEAEYGLIPIVVVNGKFDFQILDRTIRDLNIDPNGLNLKFPIIDTLVCDMKLWKWRRGRRTLTATCAAYNIVIRGAHQADGDCVAAMRLARAMAKRFPRFGRADIWRLQELQREASAERAAQFQAYRRSDGVEPDFTVDGCWPYCQGHSDSERKAS